MSVFDVTSFNIHGARHHKTFAPYDPTSTLRSFDTDVISLAEAFVPDNSPGVLAKFAQDEGYEFLFVPMVRGQSDAPRISTSLDKSFGDGAYGLVFMSRLPVISHKVLPLPEFKNDRCERYALKVEAKVGSTVVTFVQTHVSSRVPTGPMTHIKGLRPIVSGVPRCVVLGDFNFWGPSTLLLLPKLSRSVKGRSWPAWRPHSQIDHILVSSDVYPQYGKVLAASGSDHLPVQASLAVNPASSLPHPLRNLYKRQTVTTR